jgi:hypothetical protein
MKTTSWISRARSLLRVFVAASLLTAAVRGGPALVFSAVNIGDGHSTAALGTVAAPAHQLTEPEPENAISAVMDAFDRYPVVALGMSHRQQDEADFSLALIRDPRFAPKVRNVVVEAGNSLYQDLLDRYVAGGDVPLEQLQLVWRNITNPGSGDALNAANGKPLVKELFDTVREVNRRLPVVRRIRVLAGDPPIVWDKVHSPADVASFMTRRDTHFASVVEKEVLARHQKALLVIGAGHVLKHPISWASQTQLPAPTVTMLIESKYPHSTYVITPHDGFADRTGELEPRLSNWPVPSLAPLRGTWLGSLDAGLPFRGKIRRVGSDPSKVEEPFPGLKLQEIADAYLYLGPAAAIREVEFPRETGTPYARELERRRMLLGGGPLPAAPSPTPR